MATVSHPDLAFAASDLAKFNSAPTTRHWRLLKGVLQYLKGTRTVGLRFGGDAVPFVGYSNSDYTGNVGTRRSRTGYVFLVYGSPVTWLSKQQSTVALSTCEAEYTALATACREALWLSQLCRFMCIDVQLPVTLYTDNAAAQTVAQGITQSTRTKHIDVSQHFARQCVMKQQVKIEHIASANNISDLFTKPLNGDALSRLAKMCGVVAAN